MTVRPLADVPGDRDVSEARVLHAGRIFDLRSEQVDLGEGGVVTREFVDHPGAVAIVALDEDERVLLLHQYRHPVRRELWEPPAGLLDVDGEDAQVGLLEQLARRTLGRPRGLLHDAGRQQRGPAGLPRP